MQPTWLETLWKMVTRYSSTGKEYFIRPEDKDQMDMFFAMKFLMAMGQMAGFSSKRLTSLQEDLTTCQEKGRLVLRKSLAAYEMIARSVLAETGTSGHP